VANLSILADHNILSRAREGEAYEGYVPRAECLEALEHAKCAVVGSCSRLKYAKVIGVRAASRLRNGPHGLLVHELAHTSAVMHASKGKK